MTKMECYQTLVESLVRISEENMMAVGQGRAAVLNNYLT